MDVLKKGLSSLLILAMMIGVICVAPLSVAAANTWDPANGVYNISTQADLFAFRDALNNEQDFEGKVVNLLNDIEISEGTDYVSPNDNKAIFCGTFNGHNKTISNINMVSSDNESVSLFANLNNAIIKDLKLNDVTIENGLMFNSAFAAFAFDDVEINNCHLNGDSLIKGASDFNSYVFSGGIVAYAAGSNLKISGCTVANTVTIGDNSNQGVRVSGGLVSFIGGTSTTVLNSINRANVVGNYTVGGIVSWIQNEVGTQGYLIIEDCINYGNVVVAYSTYESQCAGGIIACAQDYSVVYIDRCANHGDITANGLSYSGSGGIAGEVAWCSIQNTYNTGTITALNSNTLGGIVGLLRTNDYFTPTFNGVDYIYYPEQFNSLINCYNTGSVYGGSTNYVSGLCGFLTDSSSSAGNSVIINAYNFGTISGGVKTGNACAEIHNTDISNTFSPYGTHCIETYTKTEGSADKTSNIGYFTSADTDGIIYPATMTTDQSEVISGQPLSDNLLKTLNNWVSDKNADLENGGNSYRYLTWKMTNPASEDGSKGVTVHPMFGVLVEQTLNFHVNEPNAADRLFRVYNGDASEAEDTTEYTFTNDTVEAFYDIPAFAGDDYVFAGWYYDADGDKDGDIPFEFGATLPANLSDVYAHWIAVGEVSKDGEDAKELPSSMGNTYKGFDLFGVQIRPEAQFDENLGEYYYGGLRFLTSISEDLLSDVDALSTETVNGNKVEYGFVTASKSTMDTVANNPSFNIDTDKYKIQYKGTNVNGVDTTQKTKSDKNFNYVTNVDCTSQYERNNKVYGSNARIKKDHHNYDDYRLATFVVTYQDKAEDMAKNVVARAYMRYYDANGLLRTFYNDYGGTCVYGGCCTSYNTVNEAITGDIKTQVQ